MSIIGESERIYKTGYFKSYIEDCSEPETKHKFSRSRTDNILGGVCAGFGEYVGVDASIVRVLFVLTVIFYGTGVLLYFILWLVIPENTSTRSLKKIESKNTVTA
jgi:phage shock protein PspC (stress-responsive transcriptional regulator)